MVLVLKLTAAGVGVRLTHDDKETSQEDHGWVSIKKLDGTELVRMEDFQHNRRYREMESRALECAQNVLARLESEVDKAPPAPAQTQQTNAQDPTTDLHLDQAASA